MLAGKGRNAAPPVIDEAAKSKLCSPMTAAALSSKISTDAQQVAHLPHTSSQAGRSWHQADSSYWSTCFPVSERLSNAPPLTRGQRKRKSCNPSAFYVRAEPQRQQAATSQAETATAAGIHNRLFPKDQALCLQHSSTWLRMCPTLQSEHNGIQATKWLSSFPSAHVAMVNHR